MRSLRRTSVEKRSTSGLSVSLNSMGTTTKPSISADTGCGYIPRAFQSESVSPKHISISYASADHDLIYESVVFFYSLSAFLLQLLHLYRTVWWLPQSYEQNAVKFYLVSPYMFGYVLTLISARWMWACFKTVILNNVPHSWHQKTRHLCQIIVIATLSLVHCYCISLIGSDDEDESHVMINRTFRLGCLLYPTFVMAVTYKHDIKNYLELVPNGLGILAVPSSSQNPGANIHHKCSNDPVQDFNQRVKNVLFHSHNMAVVCTLLPLCFAQTFIHFDIYMAIQHFLLVWAGSLTLNAVHAFPPKYCDVLHSSARHLGYWDHLGPNTVSSVQSVDWCPHTVWKQGSVVRSDNEIYRARSDVNSAEPGLIHHERFYALFINAALFQISLLVFQLALVMLQLFLLFRSSEWYQMISLSMLQAAGGYSLFKLMRDAVVVWRLSLAEDMLKTA